MLENGFMRAAHSEPPRSILTPNRAKASETVPLSPDKSIFQLLRSIPFPTI
jgi:hypothetical protein